ncbi:dTDP-4-dehydrorhamnose reductase [Candidatus Magnetoovum chiemensis]|nr:dTDP-4-dehydrorhamnose reductase [Candidatus Magnetoovum chiemensis]
MKIAITGADGMLAKDLIELLSNAHSCRGFSKNELDITSEDSINTALDNLTPDIIINCAAYTKVDLAEKDKNMALEVNSLGVQNLAIACRQRKIPLCHISTDYVFDGTKTSPYKPSDNVNPINHYGYSKLAGEKYIQWILNDFYIIRTSWLYGSHGPNFVKTILKLALTNSEIKVVNDQKGAPTWTVNLSACIKNIIEKKKPGIYHFTDETDKELTWHDFACAIINQKGLNTKIIPITTAEFPRPAKRPAYSVLDTNLTKLVTKSNYMRWDYCLNKFLSSEGG